MADERPLIIPIDSIEKDFEDFLSQESNNRIIFSGPFGIGKSYFLNKFFKNRESKYLPIFLRPVNYSLLSNEDVFRLIKYDILLQLITIEGFNIENEFNFSETDFNKSFIGENGFLILYNLLKLIPKIKSTIDGIEKLGEILEAYKKGKANLNRHPDIKMLFEFQHETQENFLLEYDHVSQFITDKLVEIIEARKGEVQLQKILIIDDLDRLDPEHIFRLFNVFSAHFDLVNYYSNEEEIKDNKFGFDKIIFVCDIENIRKIFAHKYGDGVDFSGYIDKYNSKQIFSFFHKGVYERYIYEHLSNKFGKFVNRDPLNNHILKLMIHFLFEGKQFNIRDVGKFGIQYLDQLVPNGEKYKHPFIQLTKLNAPTDVYLRDHIICQLIYILSIHFGSSTIFREKLVRAYENINFEVDEYSKLYIPDLFTQLVLFADYKNHKFLSSENNGNSYEYENIPYRLINGKEQHAFRSEFMWYRIEYINSNQKINQALFSKALYEACIIIIDSGILKL